MASQWMRSPAKRCWRWCAGLIWIPANCRRGRLRRAWRAKRIRSTTFPSARQRATQSSWPGGRCALPGGTSRSCAMIPAAAGAYTNARCCSSFCWRCARCFPACGFTSIIPSAPASTPRCRRTRRSRRRTWRRSGTSAAASWRRTIRSCGSAWTSTTRLTSLPPTGRRTR